MSINDRTLGVAEDRNKLRAEILKSIIMVIYHNNYNRYKKIIMVKGWVIFIEYSNNLYSNLY